MLESSTSREGEEVVAVTGRTVFGRSDDVISRIRSIEIESKYRSRPRRTKLANGPCSMFNRESLTSELEGSTRLGITQKIWRFH